MLERETFRLRGVCRAGSQIFNIPLGKLVVDQKSGLKSIDPVGPIFHPLLVFKALLLLG